MRPGVPLELATAGVQKRVPKPLPFRSTPVTSSMAASTIEPSNSSEATKRTRMFAVGLMKSAISNSNRNQPPTDSQPVGPTTSTLVQVAPELFEMSTSSTSSFGEAPRLFENQRQ